MRSLLILSALGGLGYLALAWLRQRDNAGHAAFADDQPHDDGSAVRDSGPEAMRDPPREWNETDEASDQSFPASDPPATY